MCLDLGQVDGTVRVYDMYIYKIQDEGAGLVVCNETKLMSCGLKSHYNTST